MSSRRLVATLVFLAAVLGGARVVEAAPAGRVLAARDPARVTRGAAKIEVAAGAELFEGDRLEAVSATRLVLGDGSMLVLARGGVISLTTYRPAQRAASIKLWAGRLWMKVAQKLWRGEHGFEVQTPNAVAGVRGTTFVVEHNHGTTKVAVLEGEVAFSGTEGDAVYLLRDGQVATLDGEGRLRLYALDIRALEDAMRTGEQEPSPESPGGPRPPVVPVPDELLERPPQASPYR